MGTATATETDPRKTARWKHVAWLAKQHAGWKCRICGRPEHPDNPLEADHIHPIAFGGDPYDPTNVRVLCPQCHDTSHSKRSRAVNWRAQQRTNDSVKPPLDREGLSLDGQAQRVREHLRQPPAADAEHPALAEQPPLVREFFRHHGQRNVIITPPPLKKRRGRRTYTKAERAAWRAKRRARDEKQRAEREARTAAMYGKRPAPPPKSFGEEMRDEWVYTDALSKGWFLVCLIGGGGAALLLATGLVVGLIQEAGRLLGS